MKYIIISDIHANLEALNKFLKIIKNINYDKIICLGDIVGYNPNPEEVVVKISSLNSLLSIRGNHDRAVITNNYSNFSYNAAVAIKWTIKKISINSYNFLKSLEIGPKFIEDDLVICHGSATDEDEYIFNYNVINKEIKWMKKNNVKILFFGHTHHKKVFSCKKENEIILINKNPVKIDSDNVYLINPGSIGQPRDGNPDSSFCYFDSKLKIAKFFRFSYPIKETQQKILNEKLPESLAYRLQAGR